VLIRFANCINLERDPLKFDHPIVIPGLSGRMVYILSNSQSGYGARGHREGTWTPADFQQVQAERNAEGQSVKGSYSRRELRAGD